MDTKGIEPLTSCVQSMRATNCAKCPSYKEGLLLINKYVKKEIVPFTIVRAENYYFFKNLTWFRAVKKWTKRKQQVKRLLQVKLMQEIFLLIQRDSEKYVSFTQNMNL